MNTFFANGECVLGETQGAFKAQCFKIKLNGQLESAAFHRKKIILQYCKTQFNHIRFTLYKDKWTSKLPEMSKYINLRKEWKPGGVTKWKGYYGRLQWLKPIASPPAFFMLCHSAQKASFPLMAVYRTMLHHKCHNFL